MYIIIMARLGCNEMSVHLITLDNAIIALNDCAPECVDYSIQLIWSCSDVTCMCLLFLVCLLYVQELAVFVTGLATDIIAELDEVRTWEEALLCVLSLLSATSA